jgi:hypothetical protein
MTVFNTKCLKPGMILHVRSYGLFGKLIRKALNVRKPDPRCWGNHDGVIIESCGNFYSGDSQPPIARLTPLSEYERQMNLGTCECRVYELKEPIDSVSVGLKVAENWITGVCSTPYDFFAFFRLAFKAFIGDWANSKYEFFRRLGQKAAGVTWANWCTEGVARCFDKAYGGKIYGNPNPTPYTTEKLVGKVFKDVTDSIIVKTC